MWPWEECVTFEQLERLERVRFWPSFDVIDHGETMNVRGYGRWAYNNAPGVITSAR